MVRDNKVRGSVPILKQEEPRPIPKELHVVYGIVPNIFGDRILMLKRSPTCRHWAGQLDLPGGKVKRGEQPKKAIERETLAETGLKLKARRVIDEIRVQSDEQLRITIFRMGRANGNPITPDEEHTKAIWIGTKNARLFKIAYPFVEVVRSQLGMNGPRP